MTTSPFNHSTPNPKFKRTIRKRLTSKSTAIIKATFFTELLSYRQLYRIYNMRG
ncbi:MAG TPA: hypothetical protein VFC67_17710 [Prolixibacteraceae bacterium]|nr:hypothetical protein [Prolixibacteraceae bacterium]